MGRWCSSMKSSAKRPTFGRPMTSICWSTLRAEPVGLARIHAVLIVADFSQDAPSPEGIAHRYRRGGAVIDILGPDNVGDRARFDLGAGRTIEAPGTTQALRRSERSSSISARQPRFSVRTSSAP